jgi:hypothetical protein
MRRLRSKVLLSVALLLRAPSIGPIATPSISTIRIAPDLVVERPQFGVLVLGEDGAEHFTAASHVPLVTGQAFGWVMKLHTDRRTVRWRERLHVPDPAPNRSAAARNPRKPLALPREQNLEGGGLIGHFWRVNSEDPGGSYAIELFVENTLVQEFVFTLDEGSGRASFEDPLRTAPVRPIA